MSARRGLKCRIVETRSGQSEHSKALAIFPRTMEIFDMAGVAAPFLDAANRVTSVAIMTHEHTLARMPFRPEDSPYSFIAMVPQNITERLLVQELQRKGGSVEYDTAFLSATQDQDVVKVVLGHNEQVSEIKAKFVVGCDGAHSQVRHTLNLPLEGGEYPDSFMLADVETNDALPADELQLCPSQFGPVAIFPMSATRRRIVATVPKAEGDVPSLGLVQQILKQRGPREIEANLIYWSSYFRIHHRHAARLRSRRIFIAGDAAHIHSPFGGQGMNTGLHDAWNLIWKLDLFLRGYGNEDLLDSYTAERLPVIRSVIGTTHFLTKVMGTPNVFVQALRDTVIPMASRLAPFQHAFVQRLSELGIAYGGSPIVEGPGTRYFDDSVRGGQGIGSRFLLLIDERDVADLAEAQRLFGGMNELLELRPYPHSGVTLVRPDGYIAYSSNSGESATTLPSIFALIERQTGRATAS